MKMKRKQIHQERTQNLGRLLWTKQSCCQPLSIVESEGFRGLILVLDPSYALPTRKTVKEMMAKKHAEELEQVKSEVQQAVAVSITADMWTSLNMEA
nr:E3 SUMO-protein ligase ZBED1-like [Nothobranchius furzeri]